MMISTFALIPAACIYYIVTWILFCAGEKLSPEEIEAETQGTVKEPIAVCGQSSGNYGIQPMSYGQPMAAPIPALMPAPMESQQSVAQK